MKNKKLIDTLILYGSFGFLLIFLYEVGVKKMTASDSYVFIMFCFVLFLIYTYRRGKNKMDDDNSDEFSEKKQKKGNKK